MLMYLYRMAGMFRDYFGQLNEAAIRDNFVIIFELLEELWTRVIPKRRRVVF